MQWSVPQHADTLERLCEALDDTGCAGAVLLGPDGIGKSTLTRLAIDRHVSTRPDAVIRRVTGTATERDVPFGAFGHLVEVADIGKPAALLRAARLSLHTGADDVLVVDDAHHLDALSATLVYQLALAGQTRMIVTTREDAAPPAVNALWADRLLRRIDVETASATTDPDDVDRFLDDLPGPARQVVDLLAAQEPIPRADLITLTSEEALHEAQALGAVEVLGAADEPLVFTAHPLFGERARAALGADGLRQINTALVPLAQARARNHPADRLRTAVLAVDSDAPLPVEQTIADAGEALRLGDVALAERLARAALSRSDTLAPRLLLAHALAWQGRGREADEVLSAVDQAELSEPELMAWALPRAANQFWMLSEPEHATAFLRTTRTRVTDPVAQITLDALSSTFAMNAGSPARAVAIATEVLASPAADDTAIAWAASAAALSAARMGRLDEVDSFAQRAFGAEHPGLLRFTVGLAQTTTLLMAGDTDNAARIAEQYTDFAELQQPGRAIGEVLLAHVMLAAERFEEAAQLLGPASATLDRTGYSWGPLSLMLQATALARLGELAESAKVLSRAESRHGTKSALFAPELGVARAWRLAAARDEHGAITAARQAAGMAERSEQFAVAVLCWRDAVRLGDARAVDSLSRIAGQVDCAVTDRALEEARLLAARP